MLATAFGGNERQNKGERVNSNREAPLLRFRTELRTKVHSLPAGRVR
jgi:hypothetical protein